MFRIRLLKLPINIRSPTELLKLPISIRSPAELPKLPRRNHSLVSWLSMRSSRRKNLLKESAHQLALQKQQQKERAARRLAKEQQQQKEAAHQLAIQQQQTGARHLENARKVLDAESLVGYNGRATLSRTSKTHPIECKDGSYDLYPRDAPLGYSHNDRSLSQEEELRTHLYNDTCVESTPPSSQVLSQDRLPIFQAATRPPINTPSPKRNSDALSGASAKAAPSKRRWIDESLAPHGQFHPMQNAHIEATWSSPEAGHVLPNAASYERKSPAQFTPSPKGPTDTLKNI
ncbi:hypothetical protein BJ508DRAFT_302277 [Ascobolus immersus RN42]|uniref:Uncharacterized protein n=1 Tax=Ascobolus immersus RN42 TaxID=1160509 RepID=A0A3N4INZ9_ASCIM|nr:hypothetical protein BJ508DRAFT_302277 [Ascobolus immersus RN42]